MFKIRSGTSTTMQIQIYVEEDLEKPFDLTNVTSVSMELYDPDSGALVKTIPCTIDDAAQGVISFSPSGIDVGIYERRFVLTYTDGTSLIIPNARVEFILVW